MITDLTFQSTAYGAIRVANRLVMAPMSRNRATVQGHATALMAKYYGQRASAGLIVSEGMHPCQVGQGFANAPGLFTNEQAASWKPVTKAVHDKGGKIVAQLMHAGRIGHPDLYPSAHRSIAPSAVAAAGEAYTPGGMKPYPLPREMTVADIEQAIADYVNAARLAIEAGFDGIEVHAGNGFLIHQFLSQNTNHRIDQFGGPVENRIRFAQQTIAACAEAIGAGRVGVRISPANPYNDIAEGDTDAIYRALVPSLSCDLAYLHIMEANNRDMTQQIRALWQGPFILNPHKDTRSWPTSTEVISPILNENLADGVALGALFLANPDLVARLKVDAVLNLPDEATFYGGDSRGYTDYPTLDQVV
ncbi:alkene reductase [Agrobacterium vitis]|uniref:Alkene reductase n=1 Tax=Agrobacterium vitis TaxID=373 RepID=A0AAE2RDK2_AGRVI|nr:alkene reductase [Agrobacterium vitis]MBF2714517.1 alkene reductase [Agrobacterium vitis]MUZ64567.1 alkene reductase [Agrobacterium vitis]MVA19115.1 alkene reductase [Agrobacterium vitis]